MAKKRKSPPKGQTGKQLDLFGEPAETNKPEKLKHKPEPIKKPAAKKKKKKLDVEDYLESAADTKQLINEPEFDGFYFKAIEMAQLVGHVLGLSSVFEIMTLEDSEKKSEILQFIEDLLETSFFFEEFGDRLENLIERAVEQGNKELVDKAIPVLRVVDMELPFKKYFWVGLFTALLDRNVNFGLKLIDSFQAELGKDKEDNLLDIDEMDKDVSNPFVELEDEFPGVLEYLDELMNGSDFLAEVAELFISGKIILGIFTKEQLEEGNQVIKEYLAENFNIQFPSNAFFSGLNQINEQQFIEFQYFLSKLMENFLTEDLIDEIFDRLDEVLNLEIEDDLFDPLDEFLDRYYDYGYAELLMILSSIFLGEMQDYFINESDDRQGPANIFPFN